MREHKYRAWSEKNKMMYYSHRPDGSDNPLWSWDVVFRKDWHDGKGPEDNGAIKMEWVGFMDKNLKEIYEGDVLKSINGLVGEVVFERGAFLINYNDTGLINTTIYSLNAYELNYTEVIGNSFENPELVK